MGTLEKIPTWQLTKVRNKKEVISEARNEGRTVHFASVMDVCHLKNSKLEPQFQKYKGRVVLRGDIVKDDSGSYAVFAEQGSSASQITAAKVMDVISRLPGCTGQEADAIFGLYSGENGRCTIIGKNSKVRMSRNLETSTKTQMAQVMVQHGRPSRSSWAKSVRSFSVRTIMGKAIRESSIRTLSTTEKKDCSCLCMWTIWNWPERDKTLTHCGKYLWKTLTLKSRHHSLTMSVRVAVNENVKQPKML